MIEFIRWIIVQKQKWKIAINLLITIIIINCTEWSTGYRGKGDSNLSIVSVVVVLKPVPVHKGFRLNNGVNGTTTIS